MAYGGVEDVGIAADAMAEEVAGAGSRTSSRRAAEASKQGGGRGRGRGRGRGKGKAAEAAEEPAEAAGPNEQEAALPPALVEQVGRAPTCEVHVVSHTHIDLNTRARHQFRIDHAAWLVLKWCLSRVVGCGTTHSSGGLPLTSQLAAGRVGGQLLRPWSCLLVLSVGGGTCRWDGTDPVACGPAVLLVCVVRTKSQV